MKGILVGRLNTLLAEQEESSRPAASPVRPAPPPTGTPRPSPRTPHASKAAPSSFAPHEEAKRAAQTLRLEQQEWGKAFRQQQRQQRQQHRDGGGAASASASTSSSRRPATSGSPSSSSSPRVRILASPTERGAFEAAQADHDAAVRRRERASRSPSQAKAKAREAGAVARVERWAVEQERERRKAVKTQRAVFQDRRLRIAAAAATKEEEREAARKAMVAHAQQHQQRLEKTWGDLKQQHVDKGNAHTLKRQRVRRRHAEIQAGLERKAHEKAKKQEAKMLRASSPGSPFGSPFGSLPGSPPVSPGWEGAAVVEVAGGARPQEAAVEGAWAPSEGEPASGTGSGFRGGGDGDGDGDAGHAGGGGGGGNGGGRRTTAKGGGEHGGSRLITGSPANDSRLRSNDSRLRSPSNDSRPSGSGARQREEAARRCWAERNRKDALRKEKITAKIVSSDKRVKRLHRLREEKELRTREQQHKELLFKSEVAEMAYHLKTGVGLSEERVRKLHWLNTQAEKEKERAAQTAQKMMESRKAGGKAGRTGGSAMGGALQEPGSGGSRMGSGLSDFENDDDDDGDIRGPASSSSRSSRSSSRRHPRRPGKGTRGSSGGGRGGGSSSSGFDSTSTSSIIRRLEPSRPCGLCCVPFPLSNLEGTVTKQAVFKVRASWGCNTGRLKSIWGVVEAPLRGGAKYDSVRICLFCAQFFGESGGGGGGSRERGAMRGAGVSGWRETIRLEAEAQ